MTPLAPGTAPLDAPRAPTALHTPATLDEALRLLDADDTAALGGGVGHALARHHRHPGRPAALVSVAGLPGFTDITWDEHHAGIGAGTSLDTCATSLPLARVWPVLTEACASVATGRIRRLVTLGGNIAARDDAHDPPVALTALGATLSVHSAHGSRSLPVADARDLRPGELVDRVVVPLPGSGRTGSAYRKFLVRGVWEYACANVAAVVVLDADGAARRLSLAVGSVTGGPVAVDLARLLGEPFGTALVAEAARAAAAATRPYGDVKGSAAYKTHMIAEFSRRALAEAGRRAQEESPEGTTAEGHR